MEIKSIYSESAIRDLYDKITHQRRLGTVKDFEIFIDNMSVIPRTNDVNNFFKFKAQFRQNSRTVVIKLYKGSSRVNVCYAFETPYLLNERQAEADNEFIKKQADKHEEILKLEYKIKRLKKKKGQLKTRNLTLEAEVKRLRGNKSTIDLVGKLAETLKPQTVNTSEAVLSSSDKTEENISGKDENTPTTLGGMDVDFLMKIYNDLKDSLTDKEFQAILGVFVSLGHYKEIIPETQEFVKEQIKIIDENPKP